MKYLAIVLLSSQLVGATLVDGTTETYQQGGYRWDGNPFCYDAGFLVEPGSQASVEQIGACYNVRKIADITPPTPASLTVEVE